MNLPYNKLTNKKNCEYILKYRIVQISGREKLEQIRARKTLTIATSCGNGWGKTLANHTYTAYCKLLTVESFADRSVIAKFFQ